MVTKMSTLQLNSKSKHRALHHGASWLVGTWMRFLPKYCPENVKVSLESDFLPVVYWHLRLRVCPVKLCVGRCLRTRKSARRSSVGLSSHSGAWPGTRTLWARRCWSRYLSDPGVGRCDLCLCMCCQMPFTSAICHKHNVMEIGVTAAGEGRRPLLAVIYDELVR